MKIICCVCKKLIEIKNTGNPKEDDLISHSYCRECYERENAEILKFIQEESPARKILTGLKLIETIEKG